MTTHKHAPFSITARVYYEDTDAGGVVYHSNYFNFAERARTELLRAHGWHRERQEKELGVVFMIRRAEIDYRAPARLDDLLHISAEVESIGNTSLTLRQTVTCDGRVLAEMKIVLVAVNAAGKPVRFPPQLRQISPLAGSR
jgi:acyl-CoA thioester hydrolase